MEPDRTVDHPLFAGVDQELLRAALAGAEELSPRKGETIYTQERFRRCLGVLLEGRVRVDKGTLAMSTLEAGDLFGAAALFSGGADYPTTLTAQTDCRILLIPQEGVRRLIREDGGFAERYVTYLSGRIRFLAGRRGGRDPHPVRRPALPAHRRGPGHPLPLL